jgi:hypothetical protein
MKIPKIDFEKINPFLKLKIKECTDIYGVKFYSIIKRILPFIWIDVYKINILRNIFETNINRFTSMEDAQRCLDKCKEDLRTKFNKII